MNKSEKNAELPNDRNKMPNEDALFDNWLESAVPPEPYTEQHLRWAFNAGGMVQRLLTSQSEEAVQGNWCEYVYANGLKCLGVREAHDETTHKFMPPEPTVQAKGDDQLSWRNAYEKTKFQVEMVRIALANPTRHDETEEQRDRRILAKIEAIVYGRE